MDLFIGTSGYDYPEWKGVFYPQDLKRKDFLSYYSQIFNALELNFSFYSMPKKDQMVSFYERTEGRVKFSVKANRLLTHEIDNSWKTVAKDFQESIITLLEKEALGTVLFQFPQSFHYEKENRYYLAGIIEEFKDFPVEVEFRHKEWVRESVLNGLAQRNAGIVFCDMPNLKNLPGNLDGKESVTKFKQSEILLPGTLAYIRLHGRNADAWYAAGESPNGSARYDYNYSVDELKEFVPVAGRFLQEGKKVHIYFNNHPNGSGAVNAETFKKLMLPSAGESVELKQ